MGRFWQTRILMEVNPIFEYVPIEEVIKNDQEFYYKKLEESDNSGKSTSFIEFMLEVINRSLRNTIEESNPANINYRKRTEHALSMLNDWFGRKEYMKINKGISTATASRDLRQLIDEKKIEARGKGRMTQYRKVG